MISSMDVYYPYNVSQHTSYLMIYYNPHYHMSSITINSNDQMNDLLYLNILVSQNEVAC
jgi:hypothetical protein